MKVKFDRQYYERALRVGLKDERIEVLKADNCSFANAGVNFLSDIFKVTLTCRIKDSDLKTKEEPIDVVVKTMPNSLFVMELVRDQELFKTELKTLNIVLPKIEKLVQKPIGPKALYGSLDEDVLIMEDLSVRGFVMKDRKKGLSLPHCVMLIDHLATFHAGSVALFEKDPETVVAFTGGIVSSQCPRAFIRMMEASLENISDLIREWQEDSYAQAADTLKELAKRIGKRSMNVYKYDYDEFCVLNHGDCWINNIMFKEDRDGKPCDILLVDFQMAGYTSPAVDLLYFLNTCPEIDILCEKDDFFLARYLKVLTATMKSLNCRTAPPTMEALKKSMYRRRAYAIFSGLILYPRMMANEEDVEDFQTLLKDMDGETRMNVFKNDNAVKAVRKLIPYMIKQGYLDP